MPTWTYSGVLSFPTLADFSVSKVRAGLILMKDANDVMAGWAYDATNDETGTEEVDGVANAAGVHYRRKDIAAP